MRPYSALAQVNHGRVLMLNNPAMTGSLLRAAARSGKDLWESFSSSYLLRAFHGDLIYQQLMVELVRQTKPSRIVETGTYFGDSTRYLASRFPSIPIDTCEINQEYAARARRRLARFDNVRLIKQTSESFIASLLDRWDHAQTLFFFLDAHWYDYWPLEDEVRQIATSKIRAVFVIDDFEVPQRPEFGFDVEGLDSRVNGGSERRVCGLNLIRPCLARGNSYHALLPAYSATDAFPETSGVLRGHIAVFQNLSDEFSHLIRGGRLVSQYYSEPNL